MTEQEFEQLWQANRQQQLANDEEYQRIKKKLHSIGVARFLCVYWRICYLQKVYRGL